MTTEREDRPRTAWRFITHGAADGAWNLAVDEALLEGCTSGPAAAPPTLRLYGWRPAALSLGRRQPAEGSHDPHYLRAEAIDLVRRPSGGLAVLHEHERTYAVVGLLRSAPFPGGVTDTYARIAAALVAALERLGIRARSSTRAPSAGVRPAGPSCFAATAPYEITVAGRKLIGSAQVRRRQAFLQHGSILLRADPARWSCALGERGASAAAAPIGLEDLAPAQTARLDAALAEGFAAAFGVELQAGTLSPAEAACAARLRCWKYDSAAWTLAGRLGTRERRWSGLAGGGAVA